MNVVVICAGVFGSWSAKWLADAGCMVTLVDAYGPANSRASSADHSRVIRAGYGADDIYSRWAAESLLDWQRLEDVARATLLARTGALFLGEPGNTYVAATYRTLTRLGRPAQQLEPAAMRNLYPQISTSGLGTCVLETDAGVIRARAAVQALVSEMASTRRVTYRPAHVAPIDEQLARCEVRDDNGTHLTADAYVVACGSWLSHVLPQSIGQRIRSTRQEVLWFGTPPGDTRFAAGRLPVWIDFAAGLYGVPDLDARGFKVGIDQHGSIVNPDTVERVVDAAVVERTRDWIATRFPGMAGAPLVESRVCQYENTSSGDFIIDRHPAWPNCWIAGGGSGHGFKHGPAVGKHVAALVTATANVIPRFALSTKAIGAARQVY